MRNGYLRFCAVNTYLDNDAEKQSLLCADKGNSLTVHQGETFTVGIHIQKLFFCIEQTLFTF